jgi:hypothetical protein
MLRAGSFGRMLRARRDRKIPGEVGLLQLIAAWQRNP